MESKFTIDFFLGGGGYVVFRYRKYFYVVVLLNGYIPECDCMRSNL